MITLKNLDTLEYYVSVNARKDYNMMNKKKDGTHYKKHRPYSLSQETMDFQELFSKAYLIYNLQRMGIEWDIKAEEEIKAKLLGLKMQETEETIKGIEQFHEKREGLRTY